MAKLFTIRANPNQRGAVLVIGLIMLLLLTIIGMASIRGTDLQERMAGNTRNLNLAFQSTEAALRVAESYLSRASIAPFNDGVGYYQDLTGAESPVLWDLSKWATHASQLKDTDVKEVAEPPRYVIEQLKVTYSPGNYGSAVDQQSLDSMAEREVYRITARGVGGTKDAETLIQSTFVR